MTYTRSLEEDILAVVNGSWQPLSLEEIWDKLAEQGIVVPILYLGKVVETLVSIDCLKKTEKEHLNYYQSPSLRHRLIPPTLENLLRQSLKRRENMKKSSKKMLAWLLPMLVMLHAGHALAASPDLSPTNLADDNTAVTQAPASSAPSIPNISTSRPSVTDASTTVPSGSFQAENGFTYTENRGQTRLWDLPETLLRVGLTDNTEFRFTTPNYINLKFNNGDTLISNFGDISVGLSHHFVGPGKIDVALIPILNIPTGANKASANAVDPEFRVAISRNITPKLLLGSQFDVLVMPGRNAPTNVTFTPTAIAYYTFTNKLTGFLEYATFIPTTRGLRTTQLGQVGATYLLIPRQQLDVRLGWGMNPVSPNILVGAGYSFRVDGLFPKLRIPGL